MAKKQKKAEYVEIDAHFDSSKKCILIDADGESEIKFKADATQLASVLTSLAKYKDRIIKLRLYKPTRNLQNARQNKKSKTYR